MFNVCDNVNNNYHNRKMSQSKYYLKCNICTVMNY